MFVKEFAMKQGVTVQAVYKLLRTHEKELEGHVETGKKGKFLDEYAMTFLEGRMLGNPVQIMDKQLEEENARLRKERDAYQDKLFALKEQLLEYQEQRKLIPDLQKQLEDKTKLIEDMQHEYDEQTEALQKKEALYNDAKTETDRLYLQNQALQKELETERNKKWYQKLFGGRYGAEN